MQDRITRDDILFSAKSFVAAMLALYLAFRLGLPRPFWALVTAYVVSQPFAGATRSKAVYRVAGTLAGAVMTVLIVPRFVGYPVPVSLIFSVWAAVCLYVSMLDRSPRSYAFMLAGYSMPIIALPSLVDMSLFSESTLFDASLARVEEIVLGIVCCTLVHSLLAPKKIDRIVLEKLDFALKETGQCISGILSDAQASDRTARLHGMSQTVTELRTLSTHLPFDTSNLRWLTHLVVELQNRFSTLVPILATVSDRIELLGERGGKGLPAHWRKTLQAIAAWTQGRKEYDPAYVVRLQREIDGLVPVIGPHSLAKDLIAVNLALELKRLLNECERCFDLRRKIDGTLNGSVPVGEARLPKIPKVSLLVDRRVALISAVAAGVAQFLSCLFWIASGWPLEVTAPVMTGVYCMFFATQDNPVPALKVQFVYITLSTLTAGLYLLVLLPSAHSFEMLMLVFAPFLLVLTVFMIKPSTAMRANPFMMLTICSLTMFDTGTADMTTFINSELSQSIGVGLAILFTGMFRIVSVTSISRRLATMMREEIASLGDRARTPSAIAVSVKMIDGISLLAPRLSRMEKETPASLTDGLSARRMLADLCVGLNMTRLLRLEKRLARFGVPIRPLLQALSASYRKQKGEERG